MIASRQLVLLLACLPFLAASCAQREVKSKVRSQFSFAGPAQDDSDKIREHFAESGWKVDENGQIVTKNEKDANLYRDQKFGKGRDYKKTAAHLSRRNVDTDEYKKPEYLDRMDYRTGESRHSGERARESDTGDHRAAEAGRAARTVDGETSLLSAINPFRERGTAREAGRSSFRTGADRIASEAPSVTALGTPAQTGHTDGAALRSVDDVRRLLHPESYD